MTRLPRAALFLAAVALARRFLAVRARRVLRVSRVVSDLDRAEAFYRDALGFTLAGRHRLDPATMRALGRRGAAEASGLHLGNAAVSLVRFEPAGRVGLSASADDLWFQHLAIVVSDMAAAYGRLSAHGGWTAMSEGGPQRLPASSGGVEAFKFRDPDGHPLELLAFPPGGGRAAWQGEHGGQVALGIDHTAVSVSRRVRSLGFYRGLGFRLEATSHNQGAAQDRLDGFIGARPTVHGLRLPGDAGPGIELLAYAPPGQAWPGRHVANLATDWTTLAASGLARPRLLRDPDGHFVLLVPETGGLDDE